METAIDPRSYTTLPRFDVRAGLALGRAMVTAAPPSAGPIVARELERVRASFAELEAAWQPVSVATPAASDRRPADFAVDAAWGALHLRLTAWGRLPADAHPEVARAETAASALFPDGLAFLKLPYERQWAESQRRLDHIDTAGLAAEVPERRVWIRSVEMGNDLSTYTGRERLRSELLGLLDDALTEPAPDDAAQREAEVA